jgi:hypothetical protein
MTGTLNPASSSPPASTRSWPAPERRLRARRRLVAGQIERELDSSRVAAEDGELQSRETRRRERMLGANAGKIRGCQTP